MRDVEAAIRRDQKSTAQQIAFLDRVQERRDLLDHMARRHNRSFPREAISLDELRALDRVLHEGDE